MEPEHAEETTSPSPPLLTERRIEIIRLMASGHTNKQIARITNVSEHTVKTQVSRIMHRLGTIDRAHTVAVAICGGHLKPEKVDIPRPNPPTPPEFSRRTRKNPPQNNA